MLKKRWFFIFFALIIIVSGCRDEFPNFKSSDNNPSMEDKSDTQRITGIIPEAKINKLIASFNSRWVNRAWVSAKYIILTDNVWATITLTDNTTEANDVVKEMVWLITWEIQPKAIKIILLKSDSMEELYFLNSGREIREGGAQNVLKYLTLHGDNPIMFFSTDGPSNNLNVFDWKQSNSTVLSRSINKWQNEWQGRVFIKANESYNSEGKLDSLVYFISLGFEGSGTDLYLAEADGILGKIIFDTLRDFSPNKILIFVIHGNGDTYAFYSMDERIDALKSSVRNWPEGKTEKLWSSFFVVKPFSLQFSQSRNK